MTSRSVTLRRGSAIATIIALTLTVLHAQKPAGRIAVFGSSVAFGTGDDLGKEGYTGRLREMLAPKGWEVLNQSRGGDNTKTMAPRFAPAGEPDPRVRYLLPVNPNYVLLGLSLGNEGIRQAEGTAGKDAIYAQFESGMRGFVERSREHHIIPVITLCYTRNDFTAVEYEYTRRMNLLINSWDVPSVNFLGAVDDGEGKWAKGFWHDSLHPNAAGHAEMTMTFVPSLFDAIEQGKPRPWASTMTGFARVTSNSSPVTFTPDAPMHPFALSVAVRAQADGTVAAIRGATLTATSEMKTEQRGGRGPLEFEATTLSTSTPFASGIAVKGGVWTYVASTGAAIASRRKADGGWHRVTVSHYTARGETLFFVDGELAGRTPERLEPTRFSVGGPAGAGLAPAPPQADYSALLIYRSALNPDEAAALQKAPLQASLEVFAPLDETVFERGAALANRAQSLSAAKAGAGIIHVEK